MCVCKVYFRCLFFCDIKRPERKWQNLFFFYHDVKEWREGKKTPPCHNTALSQCWCDGEFTWNEQLIAMNHPHSGEIWIGVAFPQKVHVWHLTLCTGSSLGEGLSLVGAKRLLLMPLNPYLPLFVWMLDQVVQVFICCKTDKPLQTYACL